MTELLEAPKVKHHLPDEPRAKAIALAELGHSYESIGPMVGVTPVTVGRWVARSGEIKGNKPIMDRTYRNTVQALDLIQDGMDVIEEDDTRQLALKNLYQLNAIAGTGTDKLQRENQPTQVNILTLIQERQQQLSDGDRAQMEGTVEGELLNDD